MEAHLPRLYRFEHSVDSSYSRKQEQAVVPESVLLRPNSGDCRGMRFSALKHGWRTPSACIVENRTNIMRLGC